MHFEVLVEDQSGKKALDILFPKFGRKFRNLFKAQRVLLPVSTNHTVCSMILKSSLSDMFSM